MLRTTIYRLAHVFNGNGRRTNPQYRFQVDSKTVISAPKKNLAEVISSHPVSNQARHIDNSIGRTLHRAALDAKNCREGRMSDQILPILDRLSALNHDLTIIMFALFAQFFETSFRSSGAF
jgi:hypothetical protein